MFLEHALLSTCVIADTHTHTHHVILTQTFLFPVTFSRAVENNESLFNFPERHTHTDSTAQIASLHSPLLLQSKAVRFFAPQTAKSPHHVAFSFQDLHACMAKISVFNFSSSSAERDTDGVFFMHLTSHVAM